MWLLQITKCCKYTLDFREYKKIKYLNNIFIEYVLKYFLYTDLSILEATPPENSQKCCIKYKTQVTVLHIKG